MFLLSLSGNRRAFLFYAFTTLQHQIFLMTLSDYINLISKRYAAGTATEHTYRGDLQNLIQDLCEGVLATNEPQRIACGAPDYVLTRKNIPVGYIEAKDVNDKLDADKSHDEQFTRYKKSLDNLVFTDYLDFHFYKNGESVTAIRIAKTEGKKIIPLTENFNAFTSLIKDFCAYTGQTIKSSQKLSEMMAGKARMLANVIERALTSDEENAADSSLKEQMKAFKDILIHDITAKEFSDIYAQTVAYGMFAARLHDASLDGFTRQEAAELIPKSNPFLRKLFGYIAGPDIDDRIVWIVDALADIFRAADVKAILKNFGKSTQQQDPIIHFYENFLAEYDPKLRKARGVWYTPEPVVNFIVRAVDDILKTEFNLPDGLADRSKTKVKIKAVTKATSDMRSKVKDTFVEQEVHKVQILDPATGTGTFLAEVIKQIYKKFEDQKGVWSNYVEEHLVPRLNGFELLMASYAMAHLKLDLLLTETGYKPKKQNRLRVYLTNSLEEHHPDTGTLFANWLSTEANEANYIKRDTPVMVVMGNPPYSISSSNKSVWIEKLMVDYKKDLNEKNIQPLSDDYLKFIRYGQHFIEKNGEGILAYISNNSFIDGIIHRQVRKNLLETFDKIYILDLHGNSKKKEIAPDGSSDQNVFDIMQGVSINIFVKTGLKKEKEFGEINHFELWGKREIKYESLLKQSLKRIAWNKLKAKRPNFYFVTKDFSGERKFELGFKINELFIISGPGVETGLDSLFVSDDKIDLQERFKKLISKDNYEFKLMQIENKKSFQIKDKLLKEDLSNPKIDIYKYHYKAFDFKFIKYLKNSLRRADYTVFSHILKSENLYLNLMRAAVDTENFQSILISNSIIDKNLFSFQTYAYPLYLYPENKSQKTLYETQERTPNLNKEIVEKIAAGLGLTFTAEKENKKNTFAPIDILDYIYAVLHSPTYRDKYKEFLKIDFPRVPYPKDELTFRLLVKLGGELRQIHLLESVTVNKPITSFPVDGSNEVVKLKYENKKVFINDEQYFDKVPQVAWEFYIGGYLPAQKWLKDRKGRALSYDDIIHYQKIIVALTETDRLMKEIDKIKVE